MTCQQCRDWLPLYAGSEIEPADSGAIEKHLEACPACRGQLAEFEVLHDTLGSMREVEWNERDFRQLQSRVNRRIRRLEWQPWLLAAAAAVLLVSLAGLLRPLPPVERLVLKTPAIGVPHVPQPRFREVAAKRLPKKPAVKPVEAMEIRIVGDDPNILIVWQTGNLPDGGGE